MRILLAGLGVALMLAACGGDGADNTAASDGGARSSDPLPAPAVSGGSVTGMPDAPGPGAPGAAGPGTDVGGFDLSAPGTGVADASSLADGQLMGDPADALALEPLVAGEPVTGAAPTPAPARAPTATPQQALDVVRAYYDAINAGDFSAARGLWVGDGAATGQSPEQFSAAFADTASIQVQMLEPEPLAGGDGRIEVPVSLANTLRDGTSSQYVGAYVIQPAADGSGGWRIESADIRQVQP